MLSTIIRARCSRLLFERTTQNFLTFSHILANRNLTSEARPKKPLGPYLLFCQEKRPFVIANNPDLSFVEISKHLGGEWKQSSDLQKQSFYIRAKELLEEYQREKDEFESLLSNTELEELQLAYQKKKLAREKRKTKAEMKKLDKPKKSKNPFTLFVMENFRKGENARSQVSRIAELWKNTSEEDRVPYQEEAKKLKEEYNIEMAAWKERMIADGREDLFEPKKTKKKLIKVSRRKKKQETKEEEKKKEDEWHEEEDDDGF